MLIDQLHLLVEAGNGGHGCDSYFMRTDKKKIAHGGNGGKGASVIFRAASNVEKIGNLKFKQHLLAATGGHGQSNKKRGADAEDMIVLVPCGTSIYDREKKYLIRELLEDGDQVVVCEGGRGGSGNIGGKEATRGEPGQRIEVELHLQMYADFFMVGLPSSGKSTLLNHLTRAHVKQGEYPFATRHAEIGIWNASEFEPKRICELPSLYEASSLGRGMGVDFLKHLDKAPFIVYVIDPVSQFSKNLKQGYSILREQLKKYNEEYLNIPSLVVINKMDLDTAQEIVKKTKLDFAEEIIQISAMTGQGMEELKESLRHHLDNSVKDA